MAAAKLSWGDVKEDTPLADIGKAAAAPTTGTNTQAAPTAPFGFGAATAAATAPGTSTFAATGSSFGMTTAAATQPAAAPFAFGAPATATAAAAPTSAFSFAPTTTPAPTSAFAFGAPATAPATASAFAFGSSAGASTTTSAPSAFAAPAFGASAFGSTPAATTPAFGGFGATAAPAASPVAPFGASASPPAVTGAFGAPTTGAFGTFGAPAAATGAPAFAFGAAATPAAAPVAAAASAPAVAASAPVASVSVAAPVAASSPGVDAVSASLGATSLAVPEDGKEDEDALKIAAYSGLHPNDQTAQVSVTVAQDDSSAVAPVNPSIYRAIETFDQLGLTKELLSGVYAMKFTTPSKIQAQALPIIMSPQHPNLIGQAHHGSGKTASFSLGVLSRVDLTKRYPQAIILCPTRELSMQVAEVIRTLAQYTTVEVFAAVPVHPPRKEKIHAQIVVGTPGTVDAKIAHRELDVKGVVMFVADEADQMIAQEGLGDKTVQIKKKLPKSAQILLFSATFDDATRKFAKVVAPNAIEIMVKTEELSLDGIKQYFMDARDEQDKYKALTEIFSLLEIGQSIIFVHTVATAKLLANKMRQDGYTVSLLHGKDMKPEERDRVMGDFRSNKTSVLITTNVLARGIDVLSVTLVINFDVPLTRHGKPDPETYIHRIGRSGRFGRKGVAINFVHDDTSRRQLAGIADHFKKNIVALPRDDFEKISDLIKKDLQ